MKSFRQKWVSAAVIAGCLTVTQGQRAFSQDTPPEKSQVLLQKVKQGELERRIALKQTEADRLKDDLEKGKKDSDALQKNLDATNALITDSGASLDQLAAEEKHLQQSIDLNELRIEAERKKSEGLRSLSAAQSRALEAINQRMAQVDVESRIRAAEVQLLTDGKPVPGEDNDEKGSPDLVKLKKMLGLNELKTASLEKVARDAMKSATAKLQLADEAAARANRMAESLKKGPEPVAEQDQSGPSVTTAPEAKDAPPKQ